MRASRLFAFPNPKEIDMNKKGDLCMPTGELQGDTKPMPDRGVKTGVTDTYGADLSGDAVNRIASMGDAAKSDGKEPA